MTELRGLTKFCLLTSHFYVAAWISCPVRADGPFNDLILYKAIKQYFEINDSGAAAAGQEQFKLRLWYSK